MSDFLVGDWVRNRHGVLMRVERVGERVGGRAQVIDCRETDGGGWSTIAGQIELVARGDAPTDDREALERWLDA